MIETTYCPTASQAQKDAISNKLKHRTFLIWDGKYGFMSGYLVNITCFYSWDDKKEDPIRFTFRKDGSEIMKY